MQIFNNEITCYVGETFNLNFKLVDKDGQPFIVPRYLDEQNNPYPSFFVFSVAPTVYNSDDIYRIWVRIDNKSQFDDVDNPIPQFKYTNVINEDDLVKVDNQIISASAHDNIGFIGSDGNLYEMTEYVFKLTNGKYVYFNTAEVDVNINAGTEYTGVELQFGFTRELTSKFGAQSYVYDLRHLACQQTENLTDYANLDIVYKQIIIKPTKFKVLYPINEKGGM